MQPVRLPRALRICSAALALCAASSAAFSQQSPALDRVGIWLGGYYSSNDTSLSAQGSGPYAGLYGKLNFEDDLGFDKHSVDPRARLDFLLGDSQGFSFDYYQIDRDLSASYAAPIPALGTDVGASLKSTVDYDFGSASYRWWFGHGDDVFGLGLGAAYYNVDFRVDGSAEAAGQGATISESYDENAWAPMLTLGWRHAFDEHWRMYIDASGVKKNGGDLSGNIWNASLGVEWFPWQNVGFALEYAASRLHLDKDYDQGAAKLDLNSDGPAFYLRARF